MCFVGFFGKQNRDGKLVRIFCLQFPVLFAVLVHPVGCLQA